MQTDIDLFFAKHLAGVVGRLESHAQHALERQRAAWRDRIHREALLQEKDFDPPADGPTAASGPSTAGRTWSA